MTERAEFIRGRMRDMWGERHRDFAERAAPFTALYAAHLIELVHPAEGERVLDLATGPGVVALQAAEAVGSSGAVVATDLVPEWREVVEERAAAAGLTNITFEVMGAESLTLPDSSFDVACCQFGLMFVPDPARALGEIRRVVRPGGRIGLVVWSTPDRTPCFSLERLLGSLAPPTPDDQLPNQFALSEPGLIERLVTEAGFAEVQSEHYTLDRPVENAEQAWENQVNHAAPPIKTALDRMTPEERDQLKASWLTDVAPYRQGDALNLPGEAIYVTARR